VRIWNENEGFMVEIKKKCSKCGLIKNPDEFHRHKSTKDGLRSMCKDCKRRDAKEYRKTHPEQQREEKRRYRKAHPEQNRESASLYYKANREKVREYQEKALLELRSFYVKHIIREKYKIPGELISEDMIIREREIIKINRIFKEIRKNGRSKTDRGGTLAAEHDGGLENLFKLLS